MQITKEITLATVSQCLPIVFVCFLSVITANRYASRRTNVDCKVNCSTMATENRREYWHWKTMIGWPRNVSFRRLKALLRVEFLAWTSKSQSVWRHLRLLNCHSFILPKSFVERWPVTSCITFSGTSLWKSCAAPDARKLCMIREVFIYPSFITFFSPFHVSLEVALNTMDHHPWICRVSDSKMCQFL